MQIIFWTQKNCTTCVSDGFAARASRPKSLFDIGYQEAAKSYMPNDFLGF